METLTDQQWDVIAIAFSAIFGLLIGSFLNVVIYRVPKNMSLSTPPSHCPGCDKPIRAYDNIPVVSYLLLRDKCRNCATAPHRLRRRQKHGRGHHWGAPRQCRKTPR